MRTNRSGSCDSFADTFRRVRLTGRCVGAAACLLACAAARVWAAGPETVVTTAPGVTNAAGAAADRVGMMRTGGDARVDLIWMPAADFVAVGDTIEVRLVARSTSASESVEMASIDVVFTWDPGAVAFAGVVTEGPYDWLFAGLPDDSGLDGLNDDLTDGDGFFQALSAFGDPAVATPEGLHVATFRFTGVSPSAETELVIEPALGMFSRSRVLGTQFVGQVVTGSLGTATLRVCAAVTGDFDDDGDRDLNDFEQFLDCFSGPATAADPPSCLVFDFDCDADVDWADYGGFARQFTGPSP